GEHFTGKLVDFTPYTVTVKTDSGEEVVLRKLAIVYYRQVKDLPASGEAAHFDTSVLDGAEPSERPGHKQEPVGQAEPHAEVALETLAEVKKPETVKTKHSSKKHSHPVDEGVDSDRTGSPNAPETDSMDE